MTEKRNGPLKKETELRTMVEANAELPKYKNLSSLKNIILQLVSPWSTIASMVKLYNK